jgi:MaoC like domain
MGINPALAGREWDAGTRSWTPAECGRYAICVGIHAPFPDPGEPNPWVLPTFVGTLWDLGSSPVRGVVNQARVRTVEQSIVVYGPLAATGTARTIARLISFADNGRDALVHAEATSIELGTGRLLAWTRTSVRVAGAGGFGGEPEPDTDWATPDRAPDHVSVYPTRPDQAQLYRMWAEQSLRYAEAPGTELPAQCLFGIAGRALLHTLAGSDPGLFGGVSVRFAAPVPAGAELVFQLWDNGDSAQFEARVDDLVVLDRGTFTRKPL